MYMNINRGLPYRQSYTPLSDRILQPSGPDFSFRITGARTARPKGMYIDMNAGKGCSSCGKSAK